MGKTIILELNSRQKTICIIVMFLMAGFFLFLLKEMVVNRNIGLGFLLLILLYFLKNFQSLLVVKIELNSNTNKVKFRKTFQTIILDSSKVIWWRIIKQQQSSNLVSPALYFYAKLTNNKEFFYPLPREFKVKTDDLVKWFQSILKIKAKSFEYRTRWQIKKPFCWPLFF